MSISQLRSVVNTSARLAARNSLLCCSLAPSPPGTSSTELHRRLASGGKYPIQEWGYAYLFRQKGRGRPISPHLSIYGPDWSWSMSGGHRIFGCALGIGSAVICAGLMALPFDFTAVVAWMKASPIPHAVWVACKFMVAWMISFHYINGIRFLGMDLAKFMNSSAQIVSGAKLVLVSSLALAAFFAFVMPSLCAK